MTATVLIIGQALAFVCRAGRGGHSLRLASRRRLGKRRACPRGFIAGRIQIAVQRCDDLCALADRRRHSLDRAGTDVAVGEDARATGQMRNLGSNALDDGGGLLSNYSLADKSSCYRAKGAHARLRHGCVPLMLPLFHRNADALCAIQ